MAMTTRGARFGRLRPVLIRTANFASQGFNSFAGFALLSIGAITLSPEAFGILGLINVGYVLVISVNQALVTEPMIVARASGVEARPDTLVAGEVAVRAAGVGLATGTVVAVSVHALTTMGLGASLLTVAVSILGCVADSLRGCLIATGSAIAPLTADVTLFVGQSLGLAALTAFASRVEFALLGWAVGPVLSASWSYYRFRPRQFRPHVREWFRGRSSALAYSLTVEAVAIAGSQFVLLGAVSKFVSISDAGAARYALSILGPVSVLFNTFRLYGLRTINEKIRGARRGGLRVAARVSSLAAIAAFAFGAILVLGYNLLPRSGTTLAAASSFFWAATFNKVAVGLCLGPTLTLRVRYIIRGPLITRAITAVGGVLVALSVLDKVGARWAVVVYSAAWLVQAAVLFTIEFRAKAFDLTDKTEVASYDDVLAEQ